MRVSKILAAASGLALIVAVPAGAEPASALAASAQTIGGFPLPGGGGSGSTKPTQRPGSDLAQVTVSQGPGSQIKTIAEAMRRVRPGGTIMLTGGVYNENIEVTKPVAIVGIPDGYGRNAIIRPSASKACVKIQPDLPLAAVTLSKLIFEFDHIQNGAPCIDIAGGTVAVRDSFIVPADSGITQRLAYGLDLRPGMMAHLAHPPRDNPSDRLELERLTRYRNMHSAPFGAATSHWSQVTGGNNIEALLHAKNVMGGGLLRGPSAGIRVTAGDVEFSGNVIVGVQKAIMVQSLDDALIRASVKDNHLIANGIGLAAYSPRANIELTSNTIRLNRDAGVYADVFDGLKLVANEIASNGEGVFLSENVRLATINSNFIVQNYGDALKVSSGFFGQVSANTIAGNDGCTVDFYSAEQKILNGANVKLVAYREFQPVIAFSETNKKIDNRGDYAPTRREQKRMKASSAGLVPMCPR